MMKRVGGNPIMSDRWAAFVPKELIPHISAHASLHSAHRMPHRSSPKHTRKSTLYCQMKPNPLEDTGCDREADPKNTAGVVLSSSTLKYGSKKALAVRSSLFPG